MMLVNVTLLPSTGGVDARTLSGKHPILMRLGKLSKPRLETLRLAETYFKFYSRIPSGGMTGSEEGAVKHSAMVSPVNSAKSAAPST